MDKRTVVKMALEGKTPPYVPWNINFTIPSTEKLQQHYFGKDLEEGKISLERAREIYGFLCAR